MCVPILRHLNIILFFKQCRRKRRNSDLPLRSRITESGKETWSVFTRHWCMTARRSSESVVWTSY